MAKPPKSRSKEAYSLSTRILKYLKTHVAEALRGQIHSTEQISTYERMLSSASKFAAIGAELRKGELADLKAAELDPGRVLEWLRARSPEDRRQIIDELVAMDRRRSVL